MAYGKQAKMLSKKEISQVLDHIKNHRYPLRDKVLFLLAFKAGLRAKEISNLRWSMITDASGQVSDVISLPDNSTKGKSGRQIPLNEDLREALIDLHQSYSHSLDSYIIKSEHGPRMLPRSISHWFRIVFKSLRLDGCSSHSGRRTFITCAARRIVEVGGSLRDVQQLAGHKYLQVTQRYIEGDSEAKRKVVQLI